MNKISKFTKQSAVYTCIMCKKQTRETGDGESSVEMCADCYEWESMQNQHSDDGHDGEMEECAECMSQMTRPANKAKQAPAETTMTIDLEPTWEQLCRMAQSGGLRPIELLPACKIADIVRQAQKAGKEKVVFTFENGEVSVEVEG